MAIGIPSTSYDLQRSKIAEEESRKRQEQQRAMQRRLTTAGFGQGSGFAEAQRRKAEAEARAQESGRLREVDIAQSAAAEREAQTAEERKLEREKMAAQQGQFGQTIGLEQQKLGTTVSEAALQRALQERMQSQQLGTTEKLETKKLLSSEKQAQLDRLNELTKQGRQLTSEEKRLQASLNQEQTLNEKKMAQEQSQFQANLGESEKERQNKLALQNMQTTAQFTMADKDAALRKELQGQQLTAEETRAVREANLEAQRIGISREEMLNTYNLGTQKLATETDLERERMTLADAQNIRALSEQEKQRLQELTIAKGELGLKTKALSADTIQANKDRELKATLAANELKSINDRAAAQLGLDQQKANDEQTRYIQGIAAEWARQVEDQRWRSEEAINSVQNQKELETLKNELATGIMDKTAQMDSYKTEQTAKQDAAYAKGAAGQAVDEKTLTATELAAYQKGKAGLAYEKYKSDQQAQIDFRNAMITQAAEDPKTYEAVFDNLSRLFRGFGLTPPVKIIPQGGR